jgi:uncharacterized membrane protein YfcA
MGAGGLCRVLDPLVIGFGLGVGVLVGLTGIGGGSLMTPLLILFAGVQPVVAIGTDLAYGAITKTVGGWRHLRQGTVDLGVSKWLAVGSVPGALLGVWLIDLLHDHYGEGIDHTLLRCIAGALLVVGTITLLRATLMPRIADRERESVFMDATARLRASSMGFVLGMLVGGTSVGSGALIGLVLMLVFRLTPHRVVGTDVFHAAILLWVAGVAHWVTGNVDLALMGNILIGSLPGVLIGSHLITRVSPAALRPALGCVLLGSAMGVLKKSGFDVPAWGILGVPLAAGALAWGMHRRNVTRGALTLVPGVTHPQRAEA